MTAEEKIMSDQSGIHVIGDENTLEHRIFLKDGGRILSPFHDVPLFANSDHTVLNMVVEIPRWTNAKFEISRTEALNPIKQDEQKGLPRYVQSCFPYKGYIWNYGALPQTWEDPSIIHPDIGFPGDNDPLDACEIGTAVAKRGEIKQVKVLGVICLIDSGETDWKTIVIDIKDPMAAKLHGIQDVYEHMPGLLEATKDWFRIYKIPQGKPPNSFALNGIFQDKLYADHVIQECSDAWKRLITGKTSCGEINLLNSTVRESPHHMGASEFQPPEQTSSRPFKAPADDWVFIDRENLGSS